LNHGRVMAGDATMIAGMTFLLLTLLASGYFGSQMTGRMISLPEGLNSSLMAYYSFDSDTSDLSGSGNHGTAAGNVHISEGRFGNAFAFDGDNDYISTWASPSLAPANALTVSAWVSFDSASGWHFCVDRFLTMFLR